MRFRRRLLAWSGAAVAAFLVISLVVHLPAVQRLMGWIDRDGNAQCPFGQTASIARAPISPVRALAFTLGVTREADVHAWATTHDVNCVRVARQPTLECLDVSGAALGIQGTPRATVWFELEGDVLRAIRTSRSAPDAATSAQTLATIAERIAFDIGPPEREAGALEPEALSGLLAQISREYRAEHRRVIVRATNMGDRFVVTESYVSL